MCKKAVIAMSGGVDSSVAAFLMKERGFDCIGATMKLFQNEEIGVSLESSCCSLEDVEDARSVARSLSMPHYVFNFSDRFRDDVIERFVSSYLRGETPNPCIDCNRYLKFEKLFLRARELGCDYVVTGHYARVYYDDSAERWRMKKALDKSKDQSYVLYSLTQEQLAHTLFPLGDMQKEDVRRLAEEHGFVNAEKRDSQDICFVPDGDYAGFIERYTHKCCPPGKYIDASGNELGTHRGVIRYTVGQRKGLGIAFGEPRYVVSVDPSANTVTLGTDGELYSKTLIADNVNWLSVPRPDAPLRASAKIRYRHKEQPATVTPLDDGRILLEFDEPQRAITKGQAVVLYDGELVLGGGTIRQAK